MARRRFFSRDTLHHARLATTAMTHRLASPLRLAANRLASLTHRSSSLCTSTRRWVGATPQVAPLEGDPRRAPSDCAAEAPHDRWLQAPKQWILAPSGRQRSALRRDLKRRQIPCIAQTRRDVFRGHIGKLPLQVFRSGAVGKVAEDETHGNARAF